MDTFIHGFNININTPPIFNVNNFYDFLSENGYAFIQNAFNVDLLYRNRELTNIINNFSNTVVNETLRQNITHNKDISEFIHTSSLVSSLKKYIAPLFCQEFCFIRKKKNAPGTRIHRDGDDTFLKNNKSINFGIYKNKNQFVYTVWVALFDVQINNSSICFLDYKKENIKIENYWVNDIAKILNEKKFLENHSIWEGRNIKKGDAVIFSSDIVHASTDCIEGVRSSLDFRLSNVDYKELLFLDHNTMVYKENTINKDYFIL